VTEVWIIVGVIVYLGVVFGVSWWIERTPDEPENHRT
jgi:predicted negative regulator of RcsB-dependent stress response